MFTQKQLSNVLAGTVFRIGSIEFISLGQNEDGVFAMFKEGVFNTRFGKNNNFAESDILKRLTESILPDIEYLVGEENVLPFVTDLSAIDGDSNYGAIKTRISIPSANLYNKYKQIFVSNNLSHWWWLATPSGIITKDQLCWVSVVSPLGRLALSDYVDGNYVRPILLLKGDIFVF